MLHKNLIQLTEQCDQLSRSYFTKDIEQIVKEIDSELRHLNINSFEHKQLREILTKRAMTKLTTPYDTQMKLLFTEWKNGQALELVMRVEPIFFEFWQANFKNVVKTIVDSIADKYLNILSQAGIYQNKLIAIFMLVESKSNVYFDVRHEIDKCNADVQLMHAAVAKVKMRLCTELESAYEKWKMTVAAKIRPYFTPKYLEVKTQSLNELEKFAQGYIKSIIKNSKIPLAAITNSTPAFFDLPKMTEKNADMPEEKNSLNAQTSDLVIA